MRTNLQGYYRKGQKLVHRVEVEKTLGFNLTSLNIVHHKNGVKTDNRLENLELTNRSDHAQIHHLKHPIFNGFKVCSKCKQTFCISMFSARRSKLGFRSECKKCQSLYRKRYYINTGE